MTDDSGAILAAIAAASAGDSIVFEPKVYKLNTGLAIMKAVSLEGNGATLKINANFPNNNTISFASTVGAALASWTQAISVGSNSLSVAIPPATLAVGDIIELNLGQDPHDPAEQHLVTICKVLSNDGATITVDTIIPYTINQGAFNHTIKKITSLVENIFIRNFVMDWFDTVTPDVQIWISLCRNVIIENISGRFTTALLFSDSSNIHARNISGSVVRLASSGGRLLNTWQTENFIVENVKFHHDHTDAAVLCESWSRHGIFRKYTVNTTAISGSNMLMVNGGSYDIFFEDVTFYNKNPIDLYGTGGQPGDIRFGYVDITGGCIHMDLHLIERLRWQGTLFNHITLVSKTISLTDGMDWTVDDFPLATGFVRRLWVNITDKTGVTEAHLRNADNTGHDIESQLVNGQWVAVLMFGGISGAGSNYQLNSFPSQAKRLAFTTTTVTPGATVHIVAEVLHSDLTFTTTGNDPLPTSFTPSAHATSHQDGGSDEIATATPTANAIPKADASGLLDAWVTPAGVKSFSPGSFTLATETFSIQSRRLKLTGTQRATLQGTAALRIT